jgi:hypothetical protein
MIVRNGQKLGSVYHGSDPRYTGRGPAKKEPAKREAPAETVKAETPAKKAAPPAPKAEKAPEKEA